MADQVLRDNRNRRGRANRGDALQPARFRRPKGRRTATKRNCGCHKGNAVHMLKALFIDVDGTLTGHARKPVDPHIRKHLATMQSKGVKIITATSHAFDEELTQRFSRYYRFDFMVLENGGVIYEKRKRGGYAKLAEYTRQNRERIRHLARLKRYFLKHTAKVRTADPLLTLKGFYEIYCLDGMFLRLRFNETSFLIRPLSANDSILPLAKRLRREARRNRWAVWLIEPSETFVGMGIARKGDGVRFLARQLKIRARDVCAIGDADNDVEMLSYAGLPACPADGTPDVISVVVKRGGIVASRKEYLGTRQILKKLVQAAQ